MASVLPNITSVPNIKNVLVTAGRLENAVPMSSSISFLKEMVNRLIDYISVLNIIGLWFQNS